MHLATFIHELDAGVEILWRAVGVRSGDAVGQAGMSHHAVLRPRQRHDLWPRPRGRHVLRQAEALRSRGAVGRQALHVRRWVLGRKLMMGGHGRQDARNHQSILIPVRRTGRDTAGPRRGEIDGVPVDLIPNLVSVARRSVAVEVTEVMVDLVQVPLLKVDGRKKIEGHREDNQKINQGGATKRQTKDRQKRNE